MSLLRRTSSDDSGQAVPARVDPETARVEVRHATNRVGSAEMRDLVTSVAETIRSWSVRNNLPEIPPYLILEQMYAMLSAEFQNRRGDQP